MFVEEENNSTIFAYTYNKDKEDDIVRNILSFSFSKVSHNLFVSIVGVIFIF